MIYPSADTIEDKVRSRYSLVVLAAKRAKQIKEGAPVLIDTASTNPLTIALEEIAAGKVTVAEADSMVPQPQTAPSTSAPILSHLPQADAATDASEDQTPDAEDATEDERAAA